ncbi:DUF7738 domain-containing protein [Nitrogeniibacter aestuarii]|uniref:DUF7738 domain-containing protein n=1 Tax=Nitrogeniibacter aestuarii TaxID=2815343 RepID=UPI001E470E9F|nr:hypothetical protein [Nitrogeniibacter aestuarii]
MKAYALVLLLGAALTTGCDASDQSAFSRQSAPSSQGAKEATSKETLREEIYRRARERNGGKEPTRLELINEFARKAYEETGAVTDYGTPRTIVRGAKPEIVIQGEQIMIDGTLISVGDPIENWQLALPGNPRCTSGINSRVLCAWDDLGIEVGSSLKDHKIANFLMITIIKEEREPWNPLMPDGSTMPEPPDLSPRNPFPGYLELDGFGIDAETEFWEIRERANPERKLRCGSNDCSHPFGGFSEKARIYLRLNSASEHGNVYEFSISGYEE